MEKKQVILYALSSMFAYYGYLNFLDIRASGKSRKSRNVSGYIQALEALLPTAYCPSVCPSV